MNSFRYFQSTEILFSNKRIEEIGEICLRFGKRGLLVSTPTISLLKPMYDRVKNYSRMRGSTLLILTRYNLIPPQIILLPVLK